MHFEPIYAYNKGMKRTAAQKLKEAMEVGRVYRRQELAPFSTSLTRHLAELVGKGDVVQAAAGLYYRPEMSRYGPLPAADEELVRAFLSDGDFLLTSLNNYNPLGLGLTQLYNEMIVYNRKRQGRFVLDRRRFSFRRPRNFPPVLSQEFLYVDVLNNRRELAEDTSNLETLLVKNAQELNPDELLQAARRYGKVYTKKFYEELLAT